MTDKKIKYTPFRAAIVESMQNLRKWVQSEFDLIADVFEYKANRIDDVDLLGFSNTNILPVNNVEELELVLENELPSHYLMHVTFDWQPYGAGFYYFDGNAGQYRKLVEYGPPGVFSLPLVIADADVPVNPLPGEMVMVDGGASSIVDGVYVYWASRPAGAGWMRLDWQDGTGFLDWQEVPVGDLDFNIDPADGNPQPGSPPYYLATGTGGADDSTGTVLASGWADGYRFAVVNERTNRNVIVDFATNFAQANVTLLPSETGVWRYSAGAFIREDQTA